MGLRKEYLHPEEIIVSALRWAELQGADLRRVAQERATNAIRVEQLEHIAARNAASESYDTEREAYHAGWLAGTQRYANLWLEVIQQTIDNHPFDEKPPRIRKGQLCLYNVQGCMCLVVARRPSSSRKPPTRPPTT